MANLVNFAVCFLFYSCLVTNTNFKFRVVSVEISDGVKKVQNMDRVHNVKLGDDVNTLARNYNMKGIVQQKTCDGVDCKTQNSGKSNGKIRGRHRKKRRRNGHPKKDNLKMSRKTKTSVTDTHQTVPKKQQRNRQSGSSRRDSMQIRNHDSKQRNKKHRNRGSRRKGRKQKKEKGISTEDIKLPDTVGGIKIELPQIHGFKINNKRRKGSKQILLEKGKAQTIVENSKSQNLSKPADSKGKVQTPKKGRHSKTKHVDSFTAETHGFQRQSKKEVKKNEKVLQTEKRKKTSKDSKDDTGTTKTTKRKTRGKLKRNRKLKVGDRHEHNHRPTQHKTSRQSKHHKKPDVIQKQLQLSHDHIQISPPSGRNEKVAQSDRRYPYYRQRYPQRAPPGVSRLEQRIHPSLWTSLSNLRHNMEKVLFTLRDKVNRVNHEYDQLYNNTRYDVMKKVREQLKIIAEENDLAYDVVLDVSQLVRYIYLRAHNHGLMSPAPRELTRIAELNLKDLSPDYTRTDRLLHQTRDTLRKVMETKRICMRQESKTKDMIEKLKNRMPNRQLDDMTRIARRLIMKRHNDRRISYAKYRLQRYQYRYNGLQNHVTNARNLSQMSFSDLKEAQKHFLQNKAYQKMISDAKAEKTRQRRSTHITRAELKRLSARAYRHARNLQKVTETIERFLVPLVNRASNFTGGKTQNVVRTQIHLILGRVKNLIKKYERKLDEIRILLGNDDIIRERCEYLFELGGFSEELTPIDCEDYGIYSGSGDLPVSTTPPSKALPTTSASTNISTTLHSVDKEEGSATTDFEFVETEDDKEKAAEENGGGLWWWQQLDDPLAGRRDLFREKLQDVALSNRTKSEELYARAEKIETRSQALSERWNQFVIRMDFNSKYVDLAKSISQTWSDTKPFVEGIKQKIINTHKMISAQVEKLNKKFPAILQKANETISKLKQNSTDDKSKDSIGVNVIPELISAVDKSRSNMASIKNIHIAQASPCKQVENFATKLRTDIAELRKKIDRARDITASMKLTVAMSGDSFISVPLKAKKDMLPTTTLEMCIKPSGTDMNVARFYDNKTSIYSVDMENSVPIVTVYDDKGDEFGNVEGSSSFDTDEWYNIRIDRFGHTVKLSTRKISEPIGTPAVMMANAFPDLQPLQSSPVTAYIGGLPPEKAEDGMNHFTGCIGEVLVDGRNVGLHGNSGKTSFCADKCSSEEKTSMVFEGNGYVKFPLRLISSTYNMDNIRLNFTTRQKDGVIFLLNHRTQMFQVLISLTLGSLHVEARTKRGTTVLRSGLNTYADGSTHNILITFETDKIEVITDKGTDNFTAETSTQEITSRLDSGIYLGGLGSKSQPLSGKTKLRSLVGCISHLEISNKHIPLFMMEESKNVHLGSCTNNIWTQCVWFESSSNPIALDETEEGDRIYLVVSSESRGTALQYKKGTDFNIEISVTADGISVYDIKEEDTKMIRNSFQHWYILEITDEDDEVKVSVLGDKVSVPYTGGFGGWFGGGGDSKYRITIGGTDDDGAPLAGGISQLLINDKPVLLTQYIEKNNLGACQHQPLEPLEEEIIEKPIC